MSENSTKNTSSGGVGFSGLLTLLFIGLKLGHVIDWSGGGCLVLCGLAWRLLSWLWQVFFWLLVVFMLPLRQ